MSLLALKRWHPEKKIEIWAQDEARLGLQPITRKIWFTKGKRPIASQCRHYQWLYSYTFVHPADGDSFWLLLPQVSIPIMNLALKEFSQAINPDNEKIIILLIDRAGWHMSKETEIPENIRLFPLPSCTPELQPTECAWPLLKESIADRAFDNLDELEQTLIPRRRWLIKHPEILKGAAGFNWIRKIEDGSN